MTTTMGPPPPRNPTTTTAAAAEPSASESTSSTAMPPPPPRNPTTTTTVAAAEPSTSESTSSTDMPPPPPRNPNPSEPDNHQQEPQFNPPQTDNTPQNPPQLADSTDDANNTTPVDVEKKQEHRNNNTTVPYTIPEWSGAPGHPFSLEVLKDGGIIDQFDVNKKGAYMFGLVDLCDFVLDHPTISRFHAVLQFKSNGGAYLYDLGSTHGTFINKNQVKKKVYMDLHVGDVIRFGHSSRLYIFQGPSDLMPPEADLKRIKKAKAREEMKDMEASLRRAKIEASRADGISWGMGEDAIEEDEDEVDEITWQTYKGQLTDKQEKTREKVIKRLEKISHMKKEIDAIRAKDIAQGGLTQGQQTQIARNEQRMSQIMEELENLEETLNESIRESLGARTGRSSRGKKKGMEDDEEDYISDDDDFYDRTQKSSKHKAGENQSVETADSLLDKKDAIVKQMEDKEKLLLNEDKPAEKNEDAEAGDELDAYMSAVSSQLVLDNKEKHRKELFALQSELDRILYLLKIADPTGEAAKKRESKEQTPKPTVNTSPAPDKNQKLQPSSQQSQNIVPLVKLIDEKTNLEAKPESEVKNEETVYTVAKPQWLGAIEDRNKQEAPKELPIEDNKKQEETDQFVDYKDRSKILTTSEDPSKDIDPGIENAAPGLIIRKRKQVEKSKVSEVKEDPDSEQTTGSELKAEDAVALLLKHSRGYHASDDQNTPLNDDVPLKKKSKKDGKKAKRVLGPERPSFLSDEPDSTTWVPPEGQSGDGRTSLNDRLGY